MSRVNQPSDRSVAEVAWLYYVKNMTQSEVAKTLKLSRPTIISYLKIAKERQIVCVKIAGEHFRINELSDRLQTRFGLDRVYVVPQEGLSAEALNLQVCEAAAHLLPDFVAPGDELGVSWGQTVWFVSEHLPHWPVENLTIRQLIGSMANPLLPTCEICSTEIARRLSASCVNLNAPAVCTNAALAKNLKAEPIIAEQLAQLQRCNKAIYSLSPCTLDTHVVQFKVATEADITDYVARGAVGIIAGRFIDADGLPVLGSLDQRLIGADHETLRRMTGLLVVSGLAKRDATLAALRGGFANVMVLDGPLAESLLEG
ncbi:MAG: sugar-binding transcriptional regulator [Rhodospirillales bacterium]